MIETARFKLRSEKKAVPLIAGLLTCRLRTVFILIASVLVNCAVLSTAAQAQTPRDPALVLQAYLRATYARDFVDACRFISTADRKVRDLNRYVQHRGAFSGFALEAAKKLSESVEIKPLQQKAAPDRIQIVVGYRVPDPHKIAPTLLSWDGYRLNSLGAAERKQLLDTLEKKQQDRSLEIYEGEERFELVKEANEWRVFLNWAAGVKIPLRLDLSESAGLEVRLSKPEIVIQPGELFEIVLKLKNRADQPVTARIGHLIEPKDLADYLDFVQCGFLLPVTIEAGKEQAYSGVYMLRGSLPEGVRQLNLTYEFRILK